MTVIDYINIESQPYNISWEPWIDEQQISESWIGWITEIKGRVTFLENEPAVVPWATTYRQDTEPTSPSEGDLWIETDNGDRIRRYDWTSWITTTTQIDWGQIITWVVDTDRLDVNDIFAQNISATWTITWAILKTSTTGKRVEMANDLVSFFNADSDGWYIEGASLWALPAVNISSHLAIKWFPTFYATASSTTSKTADTWLKVDMAWTEYWIPATAV